MIRTTAILGLMLALCATPALGDSVTGAIQDGYGRLTFNLAGNSGKITADTTGGVLTIAFAGKTSINPAAIVAAMPRVITGGKSDADGTMLRFTLVQPVKLHVSQIGDKAVVDIAPTDFAGRMPDLVAPPKPQPKPLDMASLPEVKLRAGTYANFTRLVFDWPKNVDYQIYPGAGKMTVRFLTLARADVSAIARFAPPWVKNAAWRIDGKSTIVEFETDSDSGYHDFKDGTHMVLDILAPKTDGKAYAPPSDSATKPSVTPMTAAPAVPRLPVKATGISQAQADAIAQTMAQVAPKPKAEAKPAEAPKPAESKTTDIKAAEAKPAEAVKAPETAEGKRTPDGALITFHNAGMLPSAVFVRGLTAWIVIENRPSFDSQHLKAALGDFAPKLDAVTSNGLGILRVTLKAPAAIAARNNGNNLEVEIGKDLAPAPTTISFVRNQSDPRRASLSAMLPLADHAFQLQDPAGGDMLTIIPAAPGSGLPAARFFADFAALPSASGLVLTPYSDGLAIDVIRSRVTIASPAGLSLTPPQMPVAQSPSALAHYGDGPSYLNFAAWGGESGGSFLATERRLTQIAAHQGPASSGGARLKLARFYLAKGFGAEALGLIKLMQANDPALAGDAQLTTMRAAADYMMGRYRDAHNELAGPAFDSDRHAALWRGLIEAKLENFKDAHAYLDQAGPVLERYETPWQARALLADADAALGMGRLDIADAALSRLPKKLEGNEAIAARLAKGRLLAGEKRYSDAAVEFEAVEKADNQELVAAAIFHHTNAALAAGAISQAQAIGQLERLRFRWRGDQLEMKTLRKLAALYFGRSQWREGLKTLRIATQAFPGDAGARKAQDDMRAAFVNLYLKGGADKLKPVDSLAMFYDNLDLTPIGPDGDEMIRRMSDRLVAVDLLGPAATLLAYQVDKRLDGVAKAQVATRLASVYLMDHKADKAVAAIRDTQITGLPDEELHARMVLEARAFAALKQWDNALDLIAVDQSDEVKRLRADIYWESGNWAVAGQKAEEMLGSRFSDAPALNATERAEVLRAAVAYSLANDAASVERIRTRFTAKMTGTPDANLFQVLAAPVDAHGLAFREAAAKIAAVDTLQAFMKDFAKRRAEMVRS